MAAITSTATGNWSATGTWAGGVVPGDGDTATVNHAVTVDVNTVVGSAPATGGTAAIAVNAALTVATGVTLEVKGDILIANVLMTLAAGSILEGNPASGVQYFVRSSTAHNQATSRLVCNGTTGSHCIVRKKAGAAGVFAITDSSWLKGGKVTATFTDFVDLGSGSVDAWKLTPTGAELYLIEDCTWTGCGRVRTETGLQAGSKFEIRRTKWSGSLNADSLLYTAVAAITTGSRVLDRCAFDKNLNMNARDVLMTECRMHLITGGTAGPHLDPASGNNFFVREGGTGSASIPSLQPIARRWYAVRDATDNGHWIAANSAASQEWQDTVLESPNGWTNGDAFVLPSPSSAQSYTFRRCYLLPNASGTSPGKIVAGLGNANVTATVEHCTAIVGGSPEQGVAVGETYVGHAGMLASVKSNLFWSVSPPSAAYFLSRIGGTVQDIASAATVDYNGVLGLSAGTDGGGVNVSSGPNFFSTGTHQSNGVTLSANPFVDSTRNVATWGAFKGGLGTYADTRDKLLALEPGWNVADLLDWVMAGFDVTDATLKDAGHDAVTIGAGVFVAPPATLSGTSAGTSTVSGTLTGTLALAGSTAGVSTGAGTLTGVVALAGTSAGASVVSGALTGAGALSGSATGTSTASGTLSGSLALAGAAAGASTTAGVLTGPLALAGSGAGLSAVAGTLTGALSLSGAASGTSTAAATMSGTLALSGTTAGLSTASATLSNGTPVGLSGAASGASVVSGALTGRLALVGAATGTSTATGTLTGVLNLTGTATGLSAGSGVMTGLIALVGTAAGSSAVTGTLTDPNAVVFGPSFLSGVTVRSPVMTGVTLHSPAFTSVRITPETP